MRFLPFDLSPSYFRLKPVSSGATGLWRKYVLRCTVIFYENYKIVNMHSSSFFCFLNSLTYCIFVRPFGLFETYIIYKIQLPPPQKSGRGHMFFQSAQWMKKNEHPTRIQKSFRCTHLEQACHFNFNILKLDDYFQTYICKTFLSIEYFKLFWITQFV